VRIPAIRLSPSTLRPARIPILPGLRKRSCGGTSSHGIVGDEFGLRNTVCHNLPTTEEQLRWKLPDGMPFTVTREDYGTLIEIFDCASGTFIRIQAGMRIAIAKEDTVSAPPTLPKHPYSAPYIPGPSVKMPPNVTVERLGTREIQDIPARGVKTTTFGTEKTVIGTGSQSVRVNFGSPMS